MDDAWNRPITAASQVAPNRLLGDAAHAAGASAAPRGPASPLSFDNLPVEMKVRRQPIMRPNCLTRDPPSYQPQTSSPGASWQPPPGPLSALCISQERLDAVLKGRGTAPPRSPQPTPRIATAKQATQRLHLAIASPANGRTSHDEQVNREPAPPSASVRAPLPPSCPEPSERAEHAATRDQQLRVTDLATPTLDAFEGISGRLQTMIADRRAGVGATGCPGQAWKG